MTEQVAPPQGGGLIPTPPLHFIPLPKQEATQLVIEHHYLHRKCPISWAWGIEVGDKILGVLTIGKPCSWSATCGLVGETLQQMQEDPTARSRDVFELNRLWLHDSLPRNSESQFIGWCLRQLKKVKPTAILLSYADTAFGHTGVVYQATGWTYAGTSAPFKDITLEGFTDYRSVPMELRGDKIGNKRAWARDPNAIRKERSLKHRYVWFANTNDRPLLRWATPTYPKRTPAGGVQ